MTVRKFIYCVPLFLWIIYTKGTLGRCPSDDIGNALLVNDRCYWMIKEHLNFTDAHRRCQEEGGILAEIPDKEAQTAVERTFSGLSTNYWIGVHDINKENYFVNMLNEPVLYTKWAADQPNNIHYEYRNADCVEIKSDGWVDVPCTLSMSAICSKRKHVTVTTSSQFSTTAVTTAEPTATAIVVVTTSSPSITTRLPMTTPTTKMQSQKTTFMSQSSTHSVFTEPSTTIQISESQTTTPKKNVDEMTTSKEKSCLCPCSRTEKQVFIKNEVELRIKVDKLKKELYVNKSSLSSSIRKRTSAVDPRPSASIVGGTLSVAVIATVVGFIILGDVVKSLKFFWKMIGGCSYR